MNAVAAWLVLLMVAPWMVVTAVGVLVLVAREREQEEACECESWRPSDAEIASAVAEWEASQ